MTGAIYRRCSLATDHDTVTSTRDSDLAIGVTVRRIGLAMTIFLASGCWGGQHYNPRAQVDIHAATDVQARILRATVAFGERNGFTVHAGNDLPRDGRLVAQAPLTRSDGVLVTSSNFMHEGTLQTFFAAEKEGADWRTVKDKWLSEVRVVVGKEGEIVDVNLEETPHEEQATPKGTGAQHRDRPQRQEVGSPS